MPVIGSSTSSSYIANPASSNASTSTSPLVNQAKLGKNAQPITVLSADPPQQVDLQTEIKESRTYQPAEVEAPKELSSIDTLQKTISSEDLQSLENINASEPKSSSVTDGMSNHPTDTQQVAKSTPSEISRLPSSGIYA